MKNREKRNLWKSLSAIMFAFVLLITGACFVDFDGDEVQAEGTITISSDGRYGTVPKDDVVKDTDGIIPVYDNYLFAGWMKENSDGSFKVVSSENNATHAKFVPKDLLTIKAQSTQNVVQEVENSADGNKYAGKYVLRFVSSVESLDYYEVGFEVVDKNGQKYTNTTDDVCYRIDSTTDGAEFTFSPKVMDVESEYFITAKFPVEPGENNENLDNLYTVRAFWKTLDGTTVYGAPRRVSVSDGLKDTTTLNMSFVTDVAVTETQLLTAAYDADNNTETEPVKKNATVIGYDEATKTVHVRITFDSVEDKASLKSVTEFAFSTQEDTPASLGSVLYRYLYTEYKGVGTADTSWYNTTDDEFVIATSADLYGLAKIANGVETGDEVTETDEYFENKKIYVVSDIEVNKGRATETGWITKDADGNDIEGATEYVWTPIGYVNATRFMGTFDGQGHTISGLNGIPQKPTASEFYVGLFGYMQNGSIKNVELKNSYFESIGSSLGSIAGRSQGTIDTVYSDAFLNDNNATGGGVGGIVGWHQGVEDITYKYENCCYAGTITTDATICGGILGRVRTGTSEITNCLFSGNIKINGGTYIGGIAGRVLQVSSKKAGVTVQNCLNTGIFSIAEGVEATYIARVLGQRQNNTVVSFSAINTYYTDEGENGSKAWYNGTTLVADGTYQVTKNDITGNSAYYNNIFDFTNTGAWALVTEAENGADGTPVLKSFTDIIPNLPVVPDTVDISWYTGIVDDDNTYSVCSSDDNEANIKQLYGLAFLCNEGITFADRTVSLESNVTVNQDSVETWDTETGEGLTEWTPIGTPDNEFAGEFNGNNHSINGIYINTAELGAGLFGGTAEGSAIRNLKLENSYIKSTVAYAGSIVGSLSGNMENVYSSASVIFTGNYVGGLVGQIWSTQSVNMSKCWFDGSMDVKANAGGLIGKISQGNVVMANCLNTAQIKCSSNFIGGLCGRILPSNLKWETGSETGETTIVMTNCLNVGSLTHNANERTGSVFGQIGTGTEVTFEQVYTTNESYIYTTNDTSKAIGTQHATKATVTGSVNMIEEKNITVSDEVTATTIKTTIAGWGFDTDSIWTVKDENEGTPVLQLN